MTTEELNAIRRLKLIELRQKETPEFRNFKMIPLLDKEIPDALLQVRPNFILHRKLIVNFKLRNWDVHVAQTIDPYSLMSLMITIMLSSIALVSTKSAHGACFNKKVPSWLSSSGANTKKNLKIQCLWNVTIIFIKKVSSFVAQAVYSTGSWDGLRNKFNSQVARGYDVWVLLEALRLWKAWYKSEHS